MMKSARRWIDLELGLLVHVKQSFGIGVKVLGWKLAGVGFVEDIPLAHQVK